MNLGELGQQTKDTGKRKIEDKQITRWFAEFKSLYAYRGNSRKQDQSPSKARKVLRTGPLQFLPPRFRPFLVPL